MRRGAGGTRARGTYQDILASGYHREQRNAGLHRSAYRTTPAMTFPRSSFAIVALLLAQGWRVTAAAQPAAQRPNILFILTDDLDVESANHMPRLKALIADQGITFTSFFITEPICCPSRAWLQV